MCPGTTGPISEEGKQRSSQNAIKDATHLMGVRPCSEKCTEFGSCAYAEVGVPCAVEGAAYTRFVDRISDLWNVTDAGAEYVLRVAGLQWLRLCRANKVLGTMAYAAFAAEREYLLREVRFLEGALTKTLQDVRRMNGSAVGGKVSIADLALDEA